MADLPHSTLRTPHLRVALFGGSFNPPHMAHVLVAAWALGGGEVDEVWVIPTGGHPFGKPLAPFDDRLAMCRLAFDWSPRLRVLDVERAPRIHYTIETLRRLAADHPDHRWRWLMGSDTVADAPQWKDFAEIERLAPPLTIPRAGHGGGAAHNFALPDLSSTRVRQWLAECVDRPALEGLVPRAVLDYITERNLYR